MNTSASALAPFQRLLWKEYRAQRALCLSMFVLGLALECAIWVVFRDPNEVAMAVMRIGLTMPVLFLIASTAIAFAGEREEGTSDWLVHIAPNPVWVLTAKWSFVLLATTAIGLFLLTVGLLLGRGISMNAPLRGIIGREILGHLLTILASGAASARC